MRKLESNGGINLATVKQVYKKRGKNGCIDYFRDKFKNDLEFVSNGYKRAISTYKSIVHDGTDPMGVIPTQLLVEHQDAISEYEKHVTEFMLELYKIPSKNFIPSTLSCLFFSYMTYLSATSDVSFLFGTIAAISLIFIIRKLVKLYGNNFFDKLESMFNKIDKDCYSAVNTASNKIYNAIVDLTYKRSV